MWPASSTETSEFRAPKWSWSPPKKTAVSTAPLRNSCHPEPTALTCHVSPAGTIRLPVLQRNSKLPLLPNSPPALRTLICPVPWSSPTRMDGLMGA